MAVRDVSNEAYARCTESITIEHAEHLLCFNGYSNIVMCLFPCHDSIASSQRHGYNALIIMYRVAKIITCADHYGQTMA